MDYFSLPQEWIDAVICQIKTFINMWQSDQSCNFLHGILSFPAQRSFAAWQNSISFRKFAIKRSGICKFPPNAINSTFAAGLDRRMNEWKFQGSSSSSSSKGTGRVSLQETNITRMYFSHLGRTKPIFAPQHCTTTGQQKGRVYYLNFRLNLGRTRNMFINESGSSFELFFLDWLVVVDGQKINLRTEWLWLTFTALIGCADVVHFKWRNASDNQSYDSVVCKSVSLEKSTREMWRS